MTDQNAPVWNLGVLLSGAGRTLEYLMAAIDRGELPAQIPGVISSVSGVRGLEVAAAAGIPARVIARADFPTLEAFSDEIYDQLGRWNVDVAIMAGYLRKMLVLPEWEGRILNIHPCLLPEAAMYAAGKGMYGDRVHAAVLANGDTVSGATVHVVTNNYDEGPPLATVTVPVESGDSAQTLATRVFTAEKELYPTTIRTYLNNHPELRVGQQTHL